MHRLSITRDQLLHLGSLQQEPASLGALAIDSSRPQQLDREVVIPVSQRRFDPVVHAAAAQRDAATLGLRNVAFFACNASVQVPSMLDAASGALRSVTISFPDPWVKERHKKRRVLQPPLARTLEAHLQPGGWFFLQSDVLEVASEMRTTVAATTSLIDQSDNDTLWDAKPPEIAAIRTERERSSHELGRSVYRCLFVKP